MRAFPLLCAAVLALPAPSRAQDTKALADGVIHVLRARQNPDGSYGSGLLDTCRVLDLLSRSPRRYNELDGPFFRSAAEGVARAPGMPEHDGWIALALAHCVTPPLIRARDAALERLSHGSSDPGWAGLLALISLRPGTTPAAPAGPADAALRCLLADDPASVPAPPPGELGAWTRWARAARLRGLRPEKLPPLPDVNPAATLDDLLLTLETLLQCHGLASGGTGGPPPTPAPPFVEPGRAQQVALDQALRFLQAHQDGGTFGLELPGWSGPEPGITALCLSSTIWLSDRLDQPRPEWIDDGLDYLLGLQREDGSILQTGLAVYTTSVALEALLDGGREADREAVAHAREFLLATQADEGEGYSAGVDPHYGGVGYGGDERPDLSNTQMAVEAAHRAGTPAGHAFYRRALIFLERCQNLGEQGQQAWPRQGGGRLVSGHDGGGTYMPGNSPAGEVQVAEGVYQARSYGSMTYALTKSFLLCGQPLDHPRVQAAVAWLGEHFDLDHNPGFDPPEKGADGLYYYYLALARTLRLLPAGTLRDEEGQTVAWRQRLQRHLLDRQRTDGSWVNERSPRWWEGAPTLCTAYAVLALRASEA